MNNIFKDPIYIWGTGKQAEIINKTYSCVLKRMNIAGYIDNNSNKWGKNIYGKHIFSPKVITESGICNIYFALSKENKRAVLEQLNKEYPGKIGVIEDEIFTRIQIINRYSGSEEDELREILSYLSGHPLEIFNYSFIDYHTVSEDDIYWDDDAHLYYVIYQGKRMYFSSTFSTKTEVKNYYESILIEQDENSPHRYLSDSFDVKKDAVVIDAGVAEGNFSLEIIDKVKKIYMFEPDTNWLEALKYTFAPYKDKIEIIPKGISNYCDDDTTTIDDAISTPVDFIKMDIEGEEYYALQGALRTISSSPDIMLAICTYHQELAYDVISSYFEKHGIQYSPSKGYMYYPDSRFRHDSLRRALILGRKD